MGLTLEEKRRLVKNKANKEFYSIPANRDRHNEIMKEYYQLNKEKLIKKAKRYKKEHADKVREQNKMYYEKNKERLKEKARIRAKKKSKK